LSSVGHPVPPVAPDPLMTAYLERRQDLVNYFRVRLRSLEAAQDVVQDIGLKLARYTGEDVANPTAFLYRLGSNLMLDHIKKERRSRRRADAWREAMVSTDGAGPSAATEPLADEAIIAREKLSQILEAVKSLPPPVREAFRLHKLEGLSHAETAAAMGVSRSSIEKYIMASLKRIAGAVGR
jgi:RNA polymerase sigma factor (sigma-70 family)